MWQTNMKPDPQAHPPHPLPPSDICLPPATTNSSIMWIFVFCWQPYSQHLEQCLARTKSSKMTCWMTEWVSAAPFRETTLLSSQALASRLPHRTARPQPTQQQSRLANHKLTPDIKWPSGDSCAQKARSGAMEIPALGKRSWKIQCSYSAKNNSRGILPKDEGYFCLMLKPK